MLSTASTSTIADSVLSPTIIPVSQAAAANITPVYDAANSPSQLKITDPALAAQVAPSKIFLLPPSTNMPSGVAVKVVSVTKDASGATLITYSQPAINEVFKSLNIRLRQNLTTADIQGASTPQGVSVISKADAVIRESAQGKILPGGVDSVGEAFKIKYVPFSADTGVSVQAKVVSKGEWRDAVTGDKVQRNSNLLLGSNIGFELKDLIMYDIDGKYLTSDGNQARDGSGQYIPVSEATTNDQFKLSGEVFVKNSAIDVDINVNDYEIKRAGARFNGTLETKLVFGLALKDTVSLTDATGELDNSLAVGEWLKLKGIDYGKERIILGSINIGVAGLVPVVVPGVGNSITTLPLAIVVALSVGMNGTIEATASTGFDYKAYFDKGAYYATNSNGKLVVEKKYDIVAHGDTPNPNVPNSAAATTAELAKKPEFRTFFKGQANVKTKSQIGIDASLAIAGMIPLQLSNSIQSESEVGVKGSFNTTTDRPGQFDVVGCAVMTNKVSLVSTIYARLVGDSDWTTVDGIDKKEVLGTYSLYKDGFPLTCTQALSVDFSYEVNPSDAAAPPTGQFKVRFKPDAKWTALTSLAASGKADVETWSWSSYGDSSLGSLLGNTDENPVHTFSAAGTYIVELKIKDSYGQSAKVTKTLTLGVTTVPGSTVGLSAITPTNTTRTFAANYSIAGVNLPLTGISVSAPNDSRASCQSPTSMAATGFQVSCQLYTLGQQPLVVRSGSQVLGTAMVSVGSNVTGVTWSSPSTNNSGKVRFGETVVYNVAGVNLLADANMGFAVQLCGVSNAEETGTASNTQRSFTCNFNNQAGAVAGQMPGVVKDAPGGQVLLSGWNVAVEVPVTPPTAASRFNDTGITASQCYQAGSDVLVSCTSADALALNNQQDGMRGRDAMAATNGGADGKLGFSFSTVGSYPLTDCVKDNVTGLMWEGKPTSGFRANVNTYTNNNNNQSFDASGYVFAVNSAGLCGSSDWRLPTVDEIQSIVDYGVSFPGPTIDAIWFPNTQRSLYWSSSSYGGIANYAWGIDFNYGAYVGYSVGNLVYLRLVRSGM